MAPTLPSFLLFSLLSLSGNLAANQAVDSPTATITSNASTIELGQSFKLRCELAHYAPGAEDYWVDFFQDHSNFCQFASSISDLNSTGHRETTFNNETHKLSSLGRHPLSSSFPVYEITVTPTLAGTKEYYCLLVPSRVDVFYSKHLSVTVTHPTPPTTAALKSNSDNL